MLKRRTGSSWLDVVAGLLGGDKKRALTRPIRRLAGERLERRMVLSTAPLAEESGDGLSLAEYVEQEHPMGPIAPASASGNENQAAQIQGTQILGAAVSAGSTDQFFGTYQGTGEGEASGSGSGVTAASGTGSGGGVTSGSGSGGSAGSGSGGGTVSGSGGGEGEGSGSSSGSGSGTLDAPPVVSEPEVTSADGTITITETISDDGGLGGIAVDLGGVEGTVLIDESGNLTIQFPATTSGGDLTITITDSAGNTTTQTVYF
jgi:hypothetical protein